MTIMSARLVVFCLAWGICAHSRGAAAIPPRRAYEDAAMRRDGSASRGQTIFENELKAACVKCHSVDGSSKRAGPDLFAIGDVALVGVPAEYFTQLGLDIKNRSPFRHTYVAELANDWIGYLPNLEGHKLGGYQVWTGFHSYAEPGTGERIADEIVDMLKELAK